MYNTSYLHGNDVCSHQELSANLKLIVSEDVWLYDFALCLKAVDFENHFSCQPRLAFMYVYHNKCHGQ